MKKNIRKTEAFKDLRKEAREAISAYRPGENFNLTILRLARVGRVMRLLLA